MKKNKGSCFIAVGLLLIAAALFITLHNLYEEMQAEESARDAAVQLERVIPKQTEGEEMEMPDYVLHPEMEMPVKTIEGQDYIGILTIRELEAELPVISQWSYPYLKLAPCRYEGSAYLGNFIIAAHNYSSHFGGLKDLRIGDAVTFTDMDGNVFAYEVAELETLQPADVEEMESGEWDLTLFTCTIGGQSRITVRCVKI